MKSHEAAVSFPLVRVWSLLRLFDSSFLPLAVAFLVASLFSDCSIEEKSEAKHTGYVYTREHWFLSISLQKGQN